VGHPLGLTFSVTRGIVSAKARDYEGQIYIQTDAAINPGNSGGPLLDKKGRIVGINTFLLRGGYALSFAIPIDRALEAASTALARLRNCDVCCPQCQTPTQTVLEYCLTCGARLSSAANGIMKSSLSDLVPVAHDTIKTCHSCGEKLAHFTP
jgi:serine protease Do